MAGGAAGGEDKDAQAFAVPPVTDSVPLVSAFCCEVVGAWREWRPVVTAGCTPALSGHLQGAAGAAAEAVQLLQSTVVEGGGSRDLEWREAVEQVKTVMKVGALPLLREVDVDIGSIAS